MIKNMPAFILFVLFLGYSNFSCSGTTDSNMDESGPPETIVGLYGQLQVDGNKITDQQGNPVALHGMSLFWSQWIYKYYNKECLTWLRDDWKCTIIRAALGVEPDGYLENPTTEISKIRTVVDACIDLGIYVIVDWHDHNAHLHTEEAKTFFRMMATDYGDYPNVIYEIYNEPEQISWKDEVKPYAEQVIAEIRKVDPDNLIIVGTPTWSQDVDVATLHPIDDDNLAYGLHFYAASHKQSIRDKARIALDRNFALFVSEFGICEYTGDGAINYTESNKWLDFMDEHQISWCKWSVADKEEGDAVLTAGASETGGWDALTLKPSGRFIRAEIIERNQAVFDSLGR